MTRRNTKVSLFALLVLLSVTLNHAFTSLAAIPFSCWQSPRSPGASTSFRQSYSPSSSRMPRQMTTTRLRALPEISSMRIGEIRDELESYGISTKSFLEKKELVAALEEARAQGKQPIKDPTSSSKSSSASSSQSQQSASSSASQSTGKTSSRDERIKQEMEKASKLSVSELRKELQARGISTKSFFEKSEFVKALAEAMVDGIGVNGNNPSASEPMDPEYRDVIMQKMSRSDPRLLQGTVIDIKLNR